MIALRHRDLHWAANLKLFTFGPSQIYGLLQRTPGWSLQQKTIPRIDKLLAELDESTPETYGSGEEYWDGEPSSSIWPSHSTKERTDATDSDAARLCACTHAPRCLLCASCAAEPRDCHLT